jgi:hypothetical protein
VQIRLFAKGSEPPPSGDGLLDDIESAVLPAVGDVVQMEGKNGEVVRRYRITARLFRSPLTGETTTVALEAEPLDDRPGTA